MSKLLPQRRRSALRVGLRVLLGLTLVILLVGVCGYFYARRQVGEFFAVRLGERFAQDGVFLGWESVDWMPEVGVRLHGLAVYRDAAKRDRLARLGLVSALRGNTSWLLWDKVIFEAADTPLVIGGGTKETRLEHAGLHLYIEPGKTDLREFHASFQGFRFEAKCLVDTPPSGTPEEVAAKRLAAKTQGLFRNVEIGWLESVKPWVQFQPEQAEPVIRLEMRSSPNINPQRIALTLEGAKFGWRGQSWDFMQAAVQIPFGRGTGDIEIEHVRLGHGGRKLEMTGAFDVAGRLLRIGRFDSGIDVLALMRGMKPSAVESLAGLTTNGGWSIRGSGEMPLDHPEDFRWQGEAALDGELAYANGGKSIVLQKPALSIHAEEQVVTLSDGQAGLWEGRVAIQRLQLHLPSKEKTLRIETNLTLDGARPPSIINSLGEDRSRAADFPLDWTGAWRIRGLAEIPVDQPERLRWRGDLALDGDLAYAKGETKVTLQRPAFSMRVEEQAVIISDGQAGLWEGSLAIRSMQVHLPSEDKTLRIETEFTLDGVRSSSIMSSLAHDRSQPGNLPLDWTGAWRIRGAAEIPIDQPERFRGQGDLALDGDLAYAKDETKVTLQKPKFSIQLKEQVVTISDGQAGLWEGSLAIRRMQVHLPSKDKTLRIETEFTLDGVRSPSIMSSFREAGRGAGSFPLDWTGAWRVNGTGEIPLDQLPQFHWSGDLTLDGELVYAKRKTRIALQKPSFSMQMGDRVVNISNLTAGLWEGTLNAPRLRFLLPSKDQKLRFETQLTLTGTQAPAVRKSFSAGQKQPRVVRLGWKSPWQISATGEIPLDRVENFHWNSEMSLGGDLVYASGATNIAFRKPSFFMRGEKQAITISAFKAGLWMGSFTAPRTVVYLASAQKKARFETEFAVSDAQLQSIIQDFGGRQKEPGFVQFRWKGGGGATPGSLTGAGTLSIGEAAFCQLPLLGRVSLFFQKLVLGFHKEVPSTMTVNHRLAGSTVYFDDLKLVSVPVRVEASGALDLAREYAQISAKGKLRKLPGVVTFLFTWLLEFKGQGPIDDMHWRLKCFPGLHRPSPAGKKAAPGPSEEEVEADRALKGLIELPGNLVEE